MTIQTSVGVAIPGISETSAMSARLCGLRALTYMQPRMRFLPQAVQYTRWSADDIRTHQLRALKETLTYAGRHVPYWRALFAKNRFEPDEVTDVSDLEALPVLTKEIVREQGSRLLSDEFSRRRLIRRQTGGSTGEPLTFFIDRLSHERQMAILWRDFWRVGVGVGDIQAKLWGYGKTHAFANRFARLTRRVYLDAFHGEEQALYGWVKTLRERSAAVIYGYTSAVFALARFMQENRLTIPSVRIVCTTGERLYPEMRNTVAAAFAAPVVDMYGAHETVRLASECIHGRMHLDTDAAVLELVEDDRSLMIGKRILLTTLLNRAMPFIRYDLGDRAESVDVPCNCGEQLPLILLRSGKEQYFFRFPSGRVVHTALFTKAIYRIPGVIRFQVRRVSERRVELLIVPVPGKEADLGAEIEEAILHCLRIAEEPIEITPRIVSEIPLSLRGKQPMVVSEWEGER